MSATNVTEGASELAGQKRRVFFWFVCSALGGICARQPGDLPRPLATAEIVKETFQIAEAMTEHWMGKYGRENATEAETETAG